MTAPPEKDGDRTMPPVAVPPVSSIPLTMRRDADGHRFTLIGELDRHTVPLVHGELLDAVADFKGAQRGLELDLVGVTKLDSAGAAMLGAVARRAAELRTGCVVIALSPAAKEALAGFHFEPVAPLGPEAPGTLARLGEVFVANWRGFIALSSLAADTMFLTFGGAAQTRRVRKGATWAEAVKIGVDALPIVGLIALLIGLVVALQSAAQLRQFGASIYVANLITASMTSEMGPLMTAIIIAGRSGAAIAAEVATMTVSQEVDALRTMGLQPVRYIVVPKFVAMTLTMPCLTLFASGLGIVGGFVIAVTYLDIGALAYWRQVRNSLSVDDLVRGFVKSIAFAWIIVLLAAHRGFQARGGAESVGRVTTASVVSSVFWVIVADAGFSLLLDFAG